MLNLTPQLLRLPPLRVSDRPAETERSPVKLINDLLKQLAANKVNYCHWKSNWLILRWLNAESDLDLLVGREDACKFASAARALGFKKVLAPAEKELPGVTNYYGYDSGSQKFVHLHAHYQLVLGHDLTKNYRLPIESKLLDTADFSGAIPVALPEIESILFVLRMVLKYSAAEVLGRRAVGKYASFSRLIQGELDFLSSASGDAKIDAALKTYFPTISPALFKACRDSMHPGASMWEQLRAKRNLERCLEPYARRNRFVEPIVRLKRRVSTMIKSKILRTNSRKRFEGGGAVIAFVGGDGAGKSTCVNEISKWLSKKFRTKAVHIGKPPKTAATMAVAAALKARRRLSMAANQSPVSFLQRLRWLCTARDRFRLYKKACRFAANGGIVICDRYPVRQVQLMDGPKIERSLAGIRPTTMDRRMIAWEKWYYEQFMDPDLLVVLRVHPDTAVRRKTDEPAEHVRPRVAELWKTDWHGTSARLIDTNREMPLVLADLRSLVWEAL